MNINEYRKKYLELEQKAAQAKQDFEIFKIGEKCNFNNLYYEEQKEHLNWFVKHFDYIERHKEYIKKKPDSKQNSDRFYVSVSRRRLDFRCRMF